MKSFCAKILVSSMTERVLHRSVYQYQYHSLYVIVSQGGQQPVIGLGFRMALLPPDKTVVKIVC